MLTFSKTGRSDLSESITNTSAITNCMSLGMNLVKLNFSVQKSQGTGKDWPQSILIKNRMRNDRIFQHAETGHSDYLLIWGLNSKCAQVSSGGSSRRRCKAVSLLIMKCQQKQTWLMRGEGLALPYSGSAR